MSGDNRRQGVAPLTLAWLALLALVTAASTYVILARHASLPLGESSVGLTMTIADPPESGSALQEGAAPVEGLESEKGPAEEAAGLAAEPAAAEDSAPANETATASDPETPIQDPPASPALPADQIALAEPADLPAWRRYASIYQSTKEQPRIAVVLTGLGYSGQATEAAIQELPAGITLSFTPYARKLSQWIALARGNGHEVMLDLPMEPVTYPDDDPGPHALLTQLDEAQNSERLRWVLGRAQGYVGLAATMGSRFASSEPHLKPVLEELKNRGFMYLDNHASDESVAARVALDIDLPHAVNDRTLDDGDAGHLAIDARLAQIERVALSDGASVAIGRPYPATLERLREWVKTLESKGFELVPITVLAQHGQP